MHTITFSLFSDLSLGTEEALLLKVMAVGNPNIPYIVSSFVLSQRIMRAEFQEIKSPRDFLRGTSFVSRLLSSYCLYVIFPDLNRSDLDDLIPFPLQ